LDLSKLSKDEAALLLRVTGRTLQRLKDENIPVHGSGHGQYYVWDELEPWWFERRMRAEGRRRIEVMDVPDPVVSEARKAAADADIAEMKAAAMRGSLMESDLVEQVWAETIARARGRLLSIPPRVSVLLMDGQTVQERKTLIEDGVYAALAELELGAENGEETN